MKKLLTPVLIGLTILSSTACKHPGKEAEIITTAAPENKDDISKNIYVDSYGEKIEVTINKTKNTATVHLNGKTYDLKKVMLYPSIQPPMKSINTLKLREISPSLRRM